jgi:hypothetical protein
MIPVPVPEVDALRHPAAEFLPFRPATRPRAASALAGCAGAQAEELGIGALLRFKSLMAAEAQHVHLARLCYDRLYAYERFAAAHASASDDLRRLALELFQIHHRRAAGLAAQ